MELALKKMTESDYQDFYKVLIPQLAEEKKHSEGVSENEATKAAEKQISRSLPQGINTPNNFFFVIVDTSSNDIGWVWYGIPPVQSDEKIAFLSDIYIKANFRGKGYGAKAMLLFEDEIRKQGLKKIILNVFNQNKIAQHLYESLNYSSVSHIMKKNI